MSRNQTDQQRIIAMWSGPRNLSTALMRSFGARTDCTAFDEPFYAAYLHATGLDHPIGNEIITDGETDPDKIIAGCLALPEAPNLINYQKHMTHHMIDGFDTSWLSDVTNIFLIREPKRVLASYSAKAHHITGEDIGFRRQRELFSTTRASGRASPAVVDAVDIRRNPEGMLRKLCDVIDIPFQTNMLSWEAGPKPEDGIWAKHWYDAAWKSTGFAPPEENIEIKLSPELQKIEAEVLPDYEYMRQFCLLAD